MDDGFTNHAKVLTAGPLAVCLTVRALCWVARYLTDGFIPKEVLPIFTFDFPPGEVEGMPAKMVAAGLWEEAEGGFQIHDYLDYNPSAKTVRQTRKSSARRMVLIRNVELRDQIRERDRDLCRYCGVKVNWRDRKGPKGATYDHVDPRGGDVLENLVISCRGCNSKKGERTPKAAGMDLRSAPDRIQIVPDSDQTTFLPPTPAPSPVVSSSSKPASTEKEPFTLRGEVSFTVPESIIEALKKCRILGEVPKLRTPAFWQAMIRAHKGIDYAAEILDAEAYLATHPGYTKYAQFLGASLARAARRAKE